MNRFKPLAVALSLLFAAGSAAQAADGAAVPSGDVNQALAAGLDMMLLNTSLLRNGDNVWERLRQGFEMDQVNSELVKRQERYYASRPELFKRTLNRSHKYLFYILNEVERRGMPTEIALLPMVESSFVPTAMSPVGASGLWQFMPTTGRHYGLEQTWWYDGRRDVTAATNAALDYLQNLYAQFGDWSLALAAYNWGEGNLSRAISRVQSAGLAPTYENIRMPAETRSYVPKLLAIRNLLADPAAHGIHLDKFPNKPYFVAVNAERHMDIALAAKFAGISVNEFMELNPAFNLPVYAYKAGRQILLPANRADRFEANLAKWDKPLLTWQVYTPSSGETVADVASRTGMSRGQLLAVNHLRGDQLNPGRPVLISMKNGIDDSSVLSGTDTTPPLSETLQAADTEAPQRAPVAAPIRVAMVAQAAAKTAPVQVATAKPAGAAPVQVASVKPAVAAPVQVATAKPAVAAPVQVAAAKPAVTAPVQVATAKPVVAAPVQVASAEPMADTSAAATGNADAARDAAVTRIADLSSSQNIELPPQIAASAAPARPAPVRVAMADTRIMQMAQASATQHTVASGDTLYNIARRYNLTVADLKAINGLKSSALRLGQTLQLRGRASATQVADSSNDAVPMAAQAAQAQLPVPPEYVVQRGDTLYSIARRFGVDRSQISRLNDARKLARLQPGQVLKLQ